MSEPKVVHEWQSEFTDVLMRLTLDDSGQPWVETKGESGWQTHGAEQAAIAARYEFARLAAKVEDWKRAYAQQEKHYQREVERLEKAWDEWKVIADEKQDENDRLRGKVERLEADPLNSIGDAIRDTAVLDRVRAERDALAEQLKAPGVPGAWVSEKVFLKLQNENKALAERVRELEERRCKRCDLPPEAHCCPTEGWTQELRAKNARLREALEGYECACEWESAEGVNPTKVHTCPRCAALEKEQ